MNTLLDTELSDLKINLDDREICNDLRVMIPRYTYTSEEVGEQIVYTFHDLVWLTLHGESLNKYGRRTKIYKYHVLNSTFMEMWADAQKQQYAEPYHSLEAAIPGREDNIVKCLSTKVSDVLSVTETVSGVNNEYMVEGYTLDVRPGSLSVKLDLREMDTDQKLNLFVVDTDEIDGDHIIGW